MYNQFNIVWQINNLHFKTLQNQNPITLIATNCTVSITLQDLLVTRTVLSETFQYTLTQTSLL
jgi:hypothetical protein